jgi:UDPglucose 6-dehydrogenase
VLTAVHRSNEMHKEWPRRRLVEALGGLRGRTIAILGLTYKAGTNTLRRSTAVETCRWLRRQGASVRAYDPVIQRLPRPIARIVDLRASCEDALRGAAALVVGAEWPEFTALTVDDLMAWMEQPVVVDPGRALEQLARDPRIRYHAVGRAA